MSVQNYADQQRDLLDRLNTATTQWWDLFVNDPVNQALDIPEILIADLMDLRRTRWYSIAGKAQVEELWKRFVDQAEQTGEVHEALFDFYMGGATYLWVSTPAVDAHIDQVIRHLSATLTWVKTSTLVPEEIRQYATSPEIMTELLRNNPWILFMVLLSMLPLKIDQ